MGNKSYGKGYNDGKEDALGGLVGYVVVGVLIFGFIGYIIGKF
jgi:hypothetical protein